MVRGMLKDYLYSSNLVLYIDAKKADTNIDRPSEYLRERCPLCFGGANWKKPDELYVMFLKIYFKY